MKRIFILGLAVCLLWSAAAVCPPAARADGPSGVGAWDISWDAGTSTITWDAVDGAVTYDISHNGARLGVYTPVGTVRADEPLTFSWFSANPKYANYFRVTARTGGGTVMCERLISLERKIFGDNCYFYDTNYHTAADALAEINPIGLTMGSPPREQSEISPNRYAMFFKPGDYVSNTNTLVGFFTSLYGLGKLPTDVLLGGVRAQSLKGNNNVYNFYRSVENVEVRNYNGGTGQYAGFNWCVAQGAPARRVNSVGRCYLAFGGDGNGWACPGYFADCAFHSGFGYGPAQQMYTRNCSLTGVYEGMSMNTFVHGCTGSFPADSGGSWSASNHVTNLATIDKIREKPFLYLDGGEYKVFVPDWRTNASGISWGSGAANGGMGPGKSLDLLETFHIAFPGDTAESINAALARGKHLLLTPGIYLLEKPIHVTGPDTVVLGLGYATLVPDENNQWGAMLVEDVGGVIVTGLYFVPCYSSVYLLRVGEEGESGANHGDNPIFLQDLFFEVRHTLQKNVQVDVELQINSSDVICDHFWMEREGGAGIGWDGNKVDYGLIVSGDRVTCNALFNECAQKYTTYWEGEYGKVFFYQNETPYDPPNQAAWKSHMGTQNGYAQYKVANKVDHHEGFGLGAYGCLIEVAQGNAYAVNAFEVPIKPGVTLDHFFMQNYGSPGNHFRFLVNQWNATANNGNNPVYYNHYPPADLSNAGIQPVDDPADPDFIMPDYGSRGIGRPFPPVNTVTGWSQAAIVYPKKDALNPCGPVKIKWQNINVYGGTASVYNVYINGVFQGSVPQTDEEYLTFDWYSTAVAKHTVRIEAVGAGVSAEEEFFLSKKGLPYFANLWRTQDMNLSWYYNWHSVPSDAACVADLDFVPMIWGDPAAGPRPEMRSVYGVDPGDPDWVSRAVGGADTVLGYNEPDISVEANMTVARGAELWPAFVRSGKRLGAPAMAYNFTGWLDPFLARVDNQTDFIPVHIYYGPNADSVKKLLTDLYQKYQKPIWITEFAAASFGGWSQDNVSAGGYTQQQVYDFMREMLPWLDAQPYVERYAWLNFSGFTSFSNHGYSALLDTDTGELTELGVIYRDLGNPEDTGAPAFVPVTGIEIASSAALAGVPLNLTGRVVPFNATNRNVTWSVRDAGTTGASVSGFFLHTSAAGTATVTATVVGGGPGGADFSRDFAVTAGAFDAEGWANDAIVYPKKDALNPCGPVEIKWKNIRSYGGDTSYYMVYIDGEKASDYDGGEVGRVPQTDDEYITFTWYSTDVAKHTVRVVAVSWGVSAEAGPHFGVPVTGSIRSYNPNNPATVSLMRGNTEIDRVATDITPGSGQAEQSFTFTNIPPGDYTLLITKPGHTSFTVRKITVGGTGLNLILDGPRPEVRMMTLLCGDITGDDMINDGDLAILWLAANYNKSAGGPGVNKLCDLNGDGMVNDGDLAILWLAVNYNKGAVVVS